MGKGSLGLCFDFLFHSGWNLSNFLSLGVARYGHARYKPNWVLRCQLLRRAANHVLNILNYAVHGKVLLGFVCQAQGNEI